MKNNAPPFRAPRQLWPCAGRRSFLGVAAGRAPSSCGSASNCGAAARGGSGGAGAAAGKTRMGAAVSPRLTGKRRPMETVRRIPFVLGRDCEILKTKGTVGKLGSSATRCIERNLKSRARFFLPATGAGREPPWQSRALFS